ncbi:MAG: hypothetical protein K8R79_00560 [Calditrichales bacterium]|nr:hypothetical protein [Calditrichales bacterium]
MSANSVKIDTGCWILDAGWKSRFCGDDQVFLSSIQHPRKGGIYALLQQVSLQLIPDFWDIAMFLKGSIKIRNLLISKDMKKKNDNIINIFL